MIESTSNAFNMMASNWIVELTEISFPTAFSFWKLGNVENYIRPRSYIETWNILCGYKKAFELL